MKILLAHNRYQVRGGEDIVFDAEKELLKRQGHSVILYERSNDDFKNISLFKKVALSISTIGSYQSYKELKGMITREKPDIVHFHNTFPLISPLAYLAAKELDIPVIQTLHNFRLLCANAYLLRDSSVCEDCIGKKVPWPAVVHACYRGSYPGSAMIAGMITFHRLIRTWEKKVDRFIALTEFGRRKFIEGGLPEAKIRVKPNFLDPDPGLRNEPERFALFVGRLSPEKGIITLIKSLKKLPHIPLKIIGEGPLFEEINRFITDSSLASSVELLGWLPHPQVLSILKRSAFLIFPSIWYENFPMSILEAFACGVPVVISDIGATREIVTDHKNGLYFDGKSVEDLQDKINWAWDHPSRMKELGQCGRQEYEKKYTAEINYKQLMEIYQKE